MNRLSMRKGPGMPAERVLSSRARFHRSRSTCEIHHLIRGRRALGRPLLAFQEVQRAHPRKDRTMFMLMKLLLPTVPRYKLLLLSLLSLLPLLPLSHNNRNLDLLDHGNRPSQVTSRMKI